ncbi:NAD-dependent epimerase/dehydratase family protein [Parapedobacter indicus]|uniref:Nucleoside-diphosphate-sugar epimerase n=1 Tax=Parapedobacter indicus TaxID=1477437 RepID=A0A1I3UBU3_9SPHI|nr:NAD-dependent epimerase/dehydratase family protein [Parapedobacter indicus]PPK99222.1 nucleoside-diphosphate-sugar epimerase [Parapedobacter indicus]SFJ80089.1 Nucleoside-diphosphate-sugar epimerase [Parapedobacter indicus]
MNVLVTGANGLLATNTIIALLSRGYRVTGLIRDVNKFLLPPQSNLKLVVGDITHAESLEKAAAGCDCIIHCAATTEQSLLRYETYYRINVIGTEHVIQAALKNAIKKIVYIGTANTFGYGSLQRPGNETHPPKAPFSHAWYAKSKLEGQQKILAAARQLSVTVVSPTFMIGPYDGKPSSGAIIRMGYGKKLVFHPPGGKNFVNVEDAAVGVVDALEKGKDGEAYLLAGENLTYRQFFRKVNDQTGQRPILIQLPRFALLAAGHLGNLLRSLGIKTPLSSTNMEILCVRNYYSNQKAQKELGTVFHPIENGIGKAIHWFKAQRML